MRKQFDIRAEQYDEEGRKVKDLILSFIVGGDNTSLHIEDLSGKDDTRWLILDTLSLTDNIEEFLSMGRHPSGR